MIAGNQKLEALAEDGAFRKDLLYRLKVLHIKVPPLRNRRDDIPMLAHSFLQKLNSVNKTRKYLAPDVIDRLTTYNFPGNVRELQNAMERAFFSARGTAINNVPLDAQGGHDSSVAEDVQSGSRIYLKAGRISGLPCIESTSAAISLERESWL